MHNLLILDLDETLIFSDRTPNNPFMKSGPFHVHKRPHLDHFINTVKDWFSLAVWSAGSEDYVQPILNQIFSGIELEFVYTEERCTFRRIENSKGDLIEAAIKNLKKVDWPIDNILVIEDCPENILTYGNVIRIKAFCGDPKDDELLNLLPFLESIKNERNIRKIEKRKWRSTKVANF